MDIELLPVLRGRKLNIRAQFLAAAGLEADTDVDSTVLIWEDDTLIATGSRKENILKCIAVDPAHQGEGLTATVLTQLRQNAFEAGFDHLFLYTKPQNLLQFSSLFFYPIAQTDKVLLMEDRPNGIRSFVDSLPAPGKGEHIGALVMNCNPFTLGHRFVIETAAEECDWVYIFVLSEDKSMFCADVRMELVKQGTADLPNVTVLPTGPYLISSATFPTYFLKERDQAQAIQCRLDIAVFTKYFAPKFGITRRYVGTEPLSAMTDQYNHALMEHLPAAGIELRLVPRLEHQGKPISATTVRQLICSGHPEAASTLVPATTYRYIREHF